MTKRSVGTKLAGIMQVVDVRWYAVHCVAMMNQLVCPTSLCIAVLQLAPDPTLRHPPACNSSNAHAVTFYMLRYLYVHISAPMQGLCGLQDDASKQQLLLQVLSKEEQLECFLRERSRSLDVKVQQAALWLPKAAQTDDSNQHEQQPQAMDMCTDTHSQRQAAGYVNVSGIDLPCRTVDTSGTGTGTTAPAPRLVHTPAMVDNIKAAALALCQNRPLLLEGPPGQSSCMLALKTCFCII